ncbi:MAG: hypothetical protein FJ271_13910 [Planctomycetes bacterium]|nr:hypothetical protein [Planctomycetota bacterium]
MTQDRKTAAGSTASGSTAILAATAVLPNSGSSRPTLSHEAHNRSLQWDELFLHATPAQRSELLSLARKQGLLYAHQLPVYANGKKSVTHHDDHGQLRALSNLATVPPERWQPVEPVDFVPIDESLDAGQRQAVARTLAATDVCLIAGLPGTGKSRVIAEIVSQAANRGLRVLFLAPHAQAIDAVLAQVADRDQLCAVRCLEPNENPDTLSAAVRSLTHGERARALRESIAAAAKARDEAEQDCQRRAQEASIWPELRQLADKCDELQTCRSKLDEHMQALPGMLKRAVADGTEASPPDGDAPFLAAVQNEQQRHRQAAAAADAVMPSLEQARAEQTLALDGMEEKRNQLLPLIQAKANRGWWSPTWWRATLAGNVVGRLGELEAKITAARGELTLLQERIDGSSRSRQEEDRAHQAEVDRLLQSELDRRRQAVLAQQATLQHEQRQLEEAASKCMLGLMPAELRPSSLSAVAVADAQARWQSQCQRDDDTCQFARRWSAFLQESADALVNRLPALANLVAATFSALAADKHFGQTSGLVFDLLILEEAHLLGEADFFRLSRRARRWTLVGEPTWLCGSRGAPAKAPPTPSFFQRLWSHFHCDPGKLPYSWHAEGDRSCCRLRSVPTEHRQHLESERLADFPDIELRILSLPHAPPALAEVVFPASLSFAEAKKFIYRELQEAAVQAAGRGTGLSQQAERWIFSFADEAGRKVREVELDAGLREIIVDCDGPSRNGVACCLTARIEFDRSAGWDRARVERWLHEHLQLRDLGRTAWLDVPYRMRPPLAALLSDMLFGGHGGARIELGHAAHNGNGTGHAAAMLFFPVPAMRRKENKNDKPAPRQADRQACNLPREGAGLELELGVGRSHERIPGDLKGLVPSRGLVNCSEAQALVRRLETLVADTDNLKSICQPHAASIAVVALYGAQVELLRRLVARSQRIQQSGIPVEVGLPSAFIQREFAIVILGLTRSNPRAVSFSDQAAHVVQALTRARSQVILIGDPGTLARRGQWQGRLDNLDETAAHQEEVLIKDLVRYLQGKGKHAWAFHLCESHP